MKPLSEILQEIRRGKKEESKIIILPQNFQKPEQMPKSSFHHYMRMNLNIICL